MDDINASMQQALRLVRSGDLLGATRALQQRLATHVRDPGHSQRAGAAPGARNPRLAMPGNWIDGEFTVVDPGVVGGEEPGVDPHEKQADASGTFRQEHFACSAGALDFKLYVPARVQRSRAPLLLMLHGCTQSADDFALGTRMNLLAGEHGYVVAYPQQSSARNPNRCWNWFRGSDQQRGHGEPATLAALTRHLVARHGLDESRVYVAGLSAGGAMAAVLASTHPDVYAAIGVHSGLPIGLASDVPSALAAMRTGDTHTRGRTAAGARRPVPAIVFHGDGDTTVHPRNGAGVISQSLGAGADSDAAGSEVTVERGVSPGGRRYTRTLHARDGRVCAEHWITHGAAHAWSGGDPAGSYTDPAGPDASAHMLRFFAACAHPA